MENRPIAMTPPMGWNSWNTFGETVNEQLIKDAADVMVDSGLKDAGYEYVVIDDCWALKERDASGRMVADPVKFPSGMKALADYIHSKGLKFGMYSCNGVRTCADYPGSFDHEFIDAKTFAEWGVDFLKYDNCFKPLNASGENLYRRMAMALRNCGREILFSACNWGTDNVEKWIRSSGAHMYRSTGDISDTWESIKRLGLSQIDKINYSGSFCFNDIDMLVVGMYGKGDCINVLHNVQGGCTDIEYRTHFAFWSIMNSPLMIGCDIRDMNTATKEILLNKDLIAINQDIEGRNPFEVSGLNSNPSENRILIKTLSNGEYAIGLFNFADKKRHMCLYLYDIGLPISSGYGMELYDCLEHKSAGVVKEMINERIEPHDCKVYRAKLVPIK